jgi:hypothetical protein
VWCRAGVEYFKVLSQHINILLDSFHILNDLYKTMTFQKLGLLSSLFDMWEKNLLFSPIVELVSIYDLGLTQSYEPTK